MPGTKPRAAMMFAMPGFPVSPTSAAFFLANFRATSSAVRKQPQK